MTGKTNDPLIIAVLEVVELLTRECMCRLFDNLSVSVKRCGCMVDKFQAVRDGHPADNLKEEVAPVCLRREGHRGPHVACFHRDKRPSIVWSE